MHYHFCSYWWQYSNILEAIESIKFTFWACIHFFMFTSCRRELLCFFDMKVFVVDVCSAEQKKPNFLWLTLQLQCIAPLRKMATRYKCLFNDHFTAEPKLFWAVNRQKQYPKRAPLSWLSQALSGGSVHRVWRQLLFWWSPSASFHSLEFNWRIVQIIRTRVLRKEIQN